MHWVFSALAVHVVWGGSRAFYAVVNVKCNIQGRLSQTAPQAAVCECAMGMPPPMGLGQLHKS